MGQPIAGSNPALSATSPEHPPDAHRRGPMTTRLRSLGLWSGLLLILAACAGAPSASPRSSVAPGSPSGSSPTAAAATDAPPVDGAPVSRSTQDRGVVLTLQLSSDRARGGDPVQLIASV